MVSGNIHNLNTWSSKAFLGSDFLGVVSSDRRTQVLTVLDQRCESVDLKKSPYLHTSLPLCVQYLCIHVCDGMNACNYNMELPSAEYTNIARLLCWIFWTIRHWTCQCKFMQRNTCRSFRAVGVWIWIFIFTYHGFWEYTQSEYLVIEKQIMGAWRAHQHRSDCKCIFAWQAMDMHITFFVAASNAMRPTRCVQRMWPVWIRLTCDRAGHLTSVRHKRTTKADVVVRCAAWYDRGSIVPCTFPLAATDVRVDCTFNIS